MKVSGSKETADVPSRQWRLRGHLPPARRQRSAQTQTAISMTMFLFGILQ